MTETRCTCYDGYYAGSPPPLCPEHPEPFDVTTCPYC